MATRTGRKKTGAVHKQRRPHKPSSTDEARLRALLEDIFGYLLIVEEKLLALLGDPDAA